jgi:hypothetical protein
MPALDLLAVLALACVVIGAVVVAWGFATGRLRIRDRRGLAVLLALLIMFVALTRDTVAGTDSGATVMITMAIVFVWGRHLVPSRLEIGTDA